MKYAFIFHSAGGTANRKLLWETETWGGRKEREGFGKQVGKCRDGRKGAGAELVVCGGEIEGGERGEMWISWFLSCFFYI